MASKEELLDNNTKEELVEKAKDAGLSGYSTLNKEELAEQLANFESEGGSSDKTLEDKGAANEAERSGFASEASDEDSEQVKSELSPEGQEALDELGDEAAAKADLALDASGPLHLQSPTERIMTGAVSEEHAKEQEEALKNKPEDWTGDVTEAGFTEDGQPKVAAAASVQPDSEKDNLSENDDREGLREVRQEDVIDFPPPVGQRNFEQEDVKGDQTIQQQANGPFGTHISPVAAAEDPTKDARRGYQQKSVFYTDGLSGTADHNHERAYEYGELLQSNDPTVRAAGDESLSEAALEAKSDAEKAHAEAVKNRDDE